MWGRKKIIGDIQISGLGTLLDGDYEVIAESEGPVGQAVAASVKGLDMYVAYCSMAVSGDLKVDRM